MSHVFFELILFIAKAGIIFIFIAGILILFFALATKNKKKMQGKLTIKHLNAKFHENKEIFLTEILSKKELKQYKKNKKTETKAATTDTIKKRIYVLTFNGDIKASAVEGLREEITALLSIATPQDEIVVRLESPGGTVHGYGLAAAQLMRIRANHIPLIICVDKIAASGGYLMAAVANKILAAPFAIIGSIGVIVQLPNFHRYLRNKQIDFEQHTAGEFKRTITLFGENTEEGREKLQHEIEEIHQLFKNAIAEYRPQIVIEQVATGEHWLGKQAMSLQLIDEIKTSDDYLFEQSKTFPIYEIAYVIKKSFLHRLGASARSLQQKILNFY